ncbi:Gliding motility-associated lipoprotein GldH [uncultured Paludibacter sp.]|uniref:Gliding motility-associated lipoprotein GldH n=1 Tax=uncultured Paludibacter sp. TaxID=497635 RepID=A0A653AGR9_9BACT|nr:Gliding motility-associated lipoprotein GldH [uncultured Paludibacter sp.]
MIKKSLILFVIILMSISCHQNEVYFQYNKIPNGGWNKDSLLNYDIHITDNAISYNFYIHVRHHGNYPYQNIWLFLQQMNPDSAITKDTIEAYLADQYGKWLGSGAGNLKEMPIIYKKQVQFPDTGVYRFKIRQGMRDSLLQGINDVGIRIEKAD